MGDAPLKRMNPTLRRAIVAFHPTGAHCSASLRNVDKEMDGRSDELETQNMRLLDMIRPGNIGLSEMKRC